jgi:hypothetical protein
MKMVKRTLIAIALVAFLASTVPAGIVVYPFGPVSGGDFNKESGVKVEGSSKVLWPYEYKALDICAMPVKMEIGMYVDVKDCKDRKILLKQVTCDEIGKGANALPCYFDCEDIHVRANFEVKLGTRLAKNDSGVIDSWEAYYKDGDDVIPAGGDYKKVTVCVKAWNARLYEGSVGTEVTVGTLYITAKPNLAPDWAFAP